MEWRMNMVSACNAFFNVIQRLRLKTFFCSCPLRIFVTGQGHSGECHYHLGYIL